MPDFKKRREEWAQALESGKYAQGQGGLRNPSDKFCCLGVACDLYDSKNWQQLEEGADFYFSDNIAMPPPEVYAFFGINEIRGNALATMNDDLGKTFKEIAQEIRKL